jgi:hypothetical protein
MIIDGDEWWMFVCDPLGVVRSIHFPEALRTIGEAAFDAALLICTSIETLPSRTGI